VDLEQLGRPYLPFPTIGVETVFNNLVQCMQTLTSISDKGDEVYEDTNQLEKQIYDF
jgi:hypothetical protein